MSLKLTRGRPRQNPEQRKKQILSVAVKLFAKQGFYKTDLQQLADQLNIAKGTIYLYYPTKDDLFLATVEHAVNKLAEYIDGQVKKAFTPIDKIKAIVHAYFNFFNKDGLLAEIITIGKREAQAHAEQVYFQVFSNNVSHIETILHDGIKENLFRPINTTSYANILANLLHGTLYIHVLGKRKVYSDSALKNTTDFILCGILK